MVIKCILSVKGTTDSSPFLLFIPSPSCFVWTWRTWDFPVESTVRVLIEEALKYWYFTFSEFSLLFRSCICNSWKELTTYSTQALSLVRQSSGAVLFRVFCQSAMCTWARAEKKDFLLLCWSKDCQSFIMFPFPAKFKGVSLNESLPWWKIFPDIERESSPKSTPWMFCVKQVLLVLSVCICVSLCVFARHIMYTDFGGSVVLWVSLNQLDSVSWSTLIH